MVQLIIFDFYLCVFITNNLCQTQNGGNKRKTQFAKGETVNQYKYPFNTFSNSYDRLAATSQCTSQSSL